MLIKLVEILLYLVFLNAYIYPLPTSLTMTNDILLFTLDMQSASDEIRLLGGRVTQQFTNAVFVAILPDISDIGKLRHSRQQPYGPLDEISQLAADAWNAFNAKLLARKDTVDLLEGLAWDAPGFKPPLKIDRVGDELDELSVRIPSNATSLYLIGSVALGLVIVSGSVPDLSFSHKEKIKTLAEVMQGLQFLVHAEPLARVTFVYNIHLVTINAVPNNNCGNDTEFCEAIWRDPVLNRLGYPSGAASCTLFAEDLRRNNHTDWSCIGFFIKYPAFHFAYADGVRSCMQYSNGDWGPDNINKVFAHEICHIFGAADEYQESNCTCAVSGYLRIPNNNCVNCAGTQHIDCLMDHNTLSICQWSRKQLGWSNKFFNPFLFKQISPICDNRNDLYVWAVDVHNTLYLNDRAVGGWGGWQANWYNAPDLQFIAPLWDVTDNVHLFGIGTDNTLYLNKRTARKWSGWQANWQQVPRLINISAFRDRDNNLYVFGIGTDNTLYLNRHEGDDWSGWQANWRGAPRLKSITAITDRSNNLYIFGIAPDNTVHFIRHAGDNWSSWQASWDNAPQLKSIVPVVDIGNTAYAFGIGMDNTVYVNFHADGQWSGWLLNWSSTPPMQALSAVVDNHNVIYLWGIGMDGTVLLNTSEVVRQWTGWTAGWGKPNDYYKPNLHFITTVFDRSNVPHVWGIGVNNNAMGNNNIEYFNWRSGNNWAGWEYQWYM